MTPLDQQDVRRARPTSAYAGRTIHLVGVGGVGMAGLAVLLKSRGCTVTGCDLRRTPRTDWLEAQGVRVFFGHDPAHLADVDLLVATPAVRPDEPELAARGKIPLRYRGDVLAELVGEADSVAVCGSHGKTTTATWTARLLLALGEDVAWCIGGETGDFPVASPGGDSPVLVVEADESDGTLSSYAARTLVVNCCEYDHPDHFKSEADYFACYDAARARAGCVIESELLDDGNADVPWRGTLAALAPHNRKNARAAIEVALRRGHAPAAIASALPAVVAALPDRRFQRLADGVYTDYAHHPTEMRCAVRMARAAATGKLRVLFQPHRYSRTKALLGDFPAAFAEADEVVLCPTYAAFERPVEGGDVADLYAACRTACASAVYLARSCREAWEHARNRWRSGDVTLLLGAGDIIDLAEEVRHPSPRVLRRHWIGAGANTWRSDLETDDEYVRTTGAADVAGATLGVPWMVGIPGTVGGWVKMNAGAFGHSFSEVLEAVKVDGEWVPSEACGFGYRTSSISGEIQDIRLKPRDAWPACESSATYRARRKAFPSGTFGSFFKNPPGDFAGRLLEAAGAKELRVGGAYVWSEHANVIVRGDGATASDVLALARLMHSRVLFRFGVALEPEVRGIVF